MKDCGGILKLADVPSTLW